MRLNRLIMSAFGPYAGREEVNFDELGTNGLYLITGDTGAGKTTIFDAITYALFGEASGDNRESNMFRSKYATSDVLTQVELYFSYGDKKYYIKRNPEYERPKSRGEGVTIEKANAELTLSDGKIVTKIKEVNTVVVDILGIDRNQFTQIAMIAQGDFYSFLPDFVTQDLVASGELCYLDVCDMDIPIWKQLIYHKNKWMSKALKTLISYIKEKDFQN